MAFVVETGAGIANANSYVTVAEFKAYCADIGTVLTAYSDTLIEQSLVRVTRAVDAKGRASFVGTKLTAAQALAWPREDAVDVYGFDILSTVVPVYVKNAVCEGAIIDLASPGALQVSLGRGGKIQEERVEGAVTVRYFDGAPSGTVYTAFNDALSPVLRNGGASGNIAVVRV
jgi:hypothetical protein